MSTELTPKKRTSIQKIDTHIKDLDRYMAFRDGKTIVDIAIDEENDPQEIRQSLIRGRAMFDIEQQMRLKDAKYEGAIENEKIRTAVRKAVHEPIVDGLVTLLKGKRTVVEKNKITGEIRTHDVTDPEIIALGIEAARKTISLEEKPVPSQTVVNVQQNVAGGDQIAGMGVGGTSYEERLERIRAIQEGKPIPNHETTTEINPSPKSGTKKSSKIVDVEAREVKPDPEDLPGDKWAQF